MSFQGRFANPHGSPEGNYTRRIDLRIIMRDGRRGRESRRWSWKEKKMKKLKKERRMKGERKEEKKKKKWKGNEGEEEKLFVEQRERKE